MPGSVGAFVEVRYWFEVMDSFVGEAVRAPCPSVVRWQ